MTKIQISDVWDATSIDRASELGSDVVHLWQRCLSAPAAEVSAYYGLLSGEEQERALRFRVESSRNDFVLTRGTLRVLLAQYLDMSPQKVRFRYEEHGKPILEGQSDLCFNVSHTGGLALLAFVRQRALGVDVENLGREVEVERLAERFFSENERQALRHLRGRELHVAFFRCWTRKEAYIKATGNGLSLPLHQFDVSVEAGDRDALLATRPDPVEARRLKICDVPIGPGYAAAVAVAE
jgi:4'-phosphopantetheinyl transferase